MMKCAFPYLLVKGDIIFQKDPSRVQTAGQDAILLIADSHSLGVNAFLTTVFNDSGLGSSKGERIIKTNNYHAKNF